MKKILVTTDFSNASKAGMRFAIQLATQMEAEPVFFHCFQALIPTTVFSSHIENALQKQGDAFMKKLQQMVAGIHKSMSIQPGAHRCAVVESLDTEGAIIDYALKNEFDFICMSTHGAGAVRKIIGTHTGSILRRSPVPVLVVPQQYRVKPVRKILYASDMENFDAEMTLVSGFADAVNAKTDLVHLYPPEEITQDIIKLQPKWRQKYSSLQKIMVEPHALGETFTSQLGHLTKKLNPSVMAFFSHVSKTWFDKFFGVSLSEKVSFTTKVPMLVYRKA